jgi:DNA-binding protein YbaB
MFGQLRDIQKKLEETKQALAEETVEASAGRGAVRVVMSGTQECKQVSIAPALVEKGEVEQIQNLLLLAINQAIHESQLMAARRLGPITGPLAGLVRGK